MNSDLLPDFVGSVKSMRQKNIQRYPCHSNRASQLGYAVPELQGCLRRGVYERTRWEDKEMWEVESIIRFKEGDRQEQHVLRDLTDAGFDCIEQQSPFEWKEHDITGHVDFKIIVDGVALPVEIKSCSPFIYQMIYTFEDLNKKSWLRAYKCQVTLYMLMQGIDWAIMIFKDKSSGLMKQINVPLDYDLGEACIRTAEIINKNLKAGTLPDKVDDIQICKDCPYKVICLPDIDFGVPLKIKDDPLFVKRIETYLEKEAIKKEAIAEYKLIQDYVRGSLDVKGKINEMIGLYHLHGGLSDSGRLLFKIEQE